MRFIYALPVSAVIAAAFALATDYILPIPNSRVAIIFVLVWACMGLYLILEDYNE